MKILILNDLYKYGGAELAAKSQLQLLAKRGADTRMITFDPAYKEGFIEPDICNIRTGGSGVAKALDKALFSPSIYYRLRSMIKAFDPDIIFLHGILRSPVSQYAALRGYKCIQTVHDYFYICPKFNCILPDSSVCRGMRYRSCCREGCLYDGSRAKLLFFRYLSRVSEILRKLTVNCFIAPSERLGAYLRAYGYKTVVINNPYPYKETWHKQGKIRKIEFLYAGRISADKGIFGFLDAFAKWNEISDECHRITVAGGFGSESDRKRFEHLEEKFSWINYVGMKGHEEVLEMMADSMFVIAPSVGLENYPTVVLDAFSAGALVVGSSRGGIKELISDGRGIGFRVNDKADIIRKLEKAVNMSDDERTKRTDRCRDYLKEHNSEEKYLDDIMALADNILNS